MTTYLRRKILVDTGLGVLAPFHRNVTVRKGVATVQYRGETRRVVCKSKHQDNPHSVWIVE